MMPFKLRTLAFGCCVMLLAVCADAASPSLTVVLPRGAQRGAEADLTFHGARLNDAKEILFYPPGIAVTKLEVVNPQQVKVHVQVDKDAKIGEYPLRLRTSSGLSELRTMYVTPFPIVQEKEPNNDQEHAQPIELNTTVTGVIENEDVDYFVIEAKKGQRIVAEAHGMRLGDAMFDPYVAILDANRFAIAECDDTALARQDPVASAIAPADGKYYIQLRDTSYTGGGNYYYLLHVGTYPRPTAVFPPGGKAGEEVELTFLGDASGPITKKIKLPDTPGETFEAFCDQDGMVPPSPNFLRVSPFPNVNEDDANHDIGHPTIVEHEIPVALNGIISKPKKTDFWKFKAKKGQQLDIRVLARAVRSPLDSVLYLYDAKGNTIAANDDSGGPDSYLRFGVPADGEYILGVFDQLQKGGPDYVYRIEITPVVPAVTFSIPQYAQNSQERNCIFVPRGNRYATLVRGTRADFGGEVALSSPDLPEGVSLACENLSTMTDVVPVLFEAKADAPVAGKLSSLVGKSGDGKTELRSGYNQQVDLIYGPNNATMYSVGLPKLAVAVVDELPFTLHLEQPKVPVVQNGALNLKVTCERRGDFKGGINVRMLFNPPGIGSAYAVDIPPDKNEVMYPVSASEGAPPRKWKICVIGVADINGPAWVSSELVDLEVAPPFVGAKIEMAAAEQGKPASVLCKLDQKTKFEGKAIIKLLGLPPNTTASDMEVTSADQQVIFNVNTTEKSPAGQHGTLFCQVIVKKDGTDIVGNTGHGGVLRIDPPPPPKKGEAPKPVVAQAPQQPTAKPLSRLEKLRLEAQEKK